MANLLWHAIAGAVAGAACSAVSSCAFGGITAAAAWDLRVTAFAGALSALLVNLDRRELPQGRRTPFGHSFAACALWTYATAMIFSVLACVRLVAFSAVCAVALGVLAGMSSHIAFDLFSEEGVYTLPNCQFSALEALPEGCGRQWAGWGLVRFNVPVLISRIVKTTCLHDEFAEGAKGEGGFNS